MQVQGYSLIWLTKTRAGSHNWSVAMGGYKALERTGWDSKEREFLFM